MFGAAYGQGSQDVGLVCQTFSVLRLSLLSCCTALGTVRRRPRKFPPPRPDVPAAAPKHSKLRMQMAGESAASQLRPKHEEQPAVDGHWQEQKGKKKRAAPWMKWVYGGGYEVGCERSDTNLWSWPPKERMKKAQECASLHLCFSARGAVAERWSCAAELCWDGGSCRRCSVKIKYSSTSKGWQAGNIGKSTQ